MIELWKGSANTWDCDEMGHMNVRVYVEKAIEGLGAFASAIELPHAFSPRSPSTLFPARQHIRFIREVLPGRPLSMTGCVLDWGEDWVDVYQDLRHGDGTPAASMRTRLIHAVTGTGKPFAWARRSKAALETLKDTPPKETAPRSLDPNGETLPAEEVTLAIAEELGTPCIGQGMVPDAHTDAYATMWAPWFMGRLSDSVPNLLFDWRRQVAEAAGDRRMGAAVLEYRLIYRRWPRAGDLFRIHSSLAGAREKTHSLVHWMLDPVTGGPWASAEAVAVTFDLDKRKVLPTPPSLIKALETLAPPGLAV